MSDYTDIQPELDDFENAVYGEEVRDSMISAIKKIHDIAESAADAPDASSATAGQAPIADGQGGWAWGDVQGGGAGTGWTTQEINLLETILENATYKTNQAANIDALISALRGGASADSVTLSASSGTLQVGNTATVTATVSGSGALQATSSNASVATVSVSGNTITITAVATGSATITVTYGTASATYSATVQSQVVTDSISLSSNSGTVNIGNTVSVTATVSGSGTLQASSSNTSIATVSVSGNTITITGVAEGSATITATYGTASATYSATVSSLLYNWDLTRSLTDTVQGAVATPYAPSGGTLPAVSANGMVFSEPAQVLDLLENYPLYGKAIELDIASFQFAGNSAYHARLLMFWKYVYDAYQGMGELVFRSGSGWSSYGVTRTGGWYKGWSTSGWGSLYASDQIDAFNGKTVRIEYDSDGNTRRLYVDGALIATDTSLYFGSDATQNARNLAIGGVSGTLDQTKGDQCYNMTITGIRIKSLT